MSYSAGGVLDGPRFEIGINDSLYPDMLRFVEEPPLRLYGMGNPNVLVPGIAFIGSRKATPYGLAATSRFAQHAAKRGVPIISGGARGCDQEAHKAALNMGCPTVVVFGSGADVAYPRRGLKLFQQVLDAGGAIVSENPWGTEPRGFMFRKRNRIIAGMAMLLVIAEAGMPSGTFSTADAAINAGRIVGTVPGSISSPYSKGANHLIGQGGHPVTDEESLDELIEIAFAQLPLSISERPGSDGAAAAWEKLLEEEPLLAALAADSYGPDELCAYFGFSGSEVACRLAQYEMEGLVERGRDGRFQAVKGRLRYAVPREIACRASEHKNAIAAKAQ